MNPAGTLAERRLGGQERRKTAMMSESKRATSRTQREHGGARPARIPERPSQVALAIGVALSAGRTGVASAQAPREGAQRQAIEEVTVTGARITATGMTTPTPVT